MKRKFSRVLLLTLFTVCTAVCGLGAVDAAVPYQSYNYDSWQNVIPAPISYEPDRAVSGADIAGVAGFSAPSDMEIDGSGNFYIADTGNNRIVVLNPDFTLKKTISTFRNKGADDTFQEPGGVAVDEAGRIHVADTKNHRIVSLNPDGTLQRVFDAGKSTLLGKNFVFLPSRIGLDGANRYYVIAANQTNGIMCFDAKGAFTGFFGSLKVQPSFSERFWKMLATQAQRSQMALFVPTEFTSLQLDQDGFVYATGGEESDTQTIHKLNPSGKDVLVNYTSKPICGDLQYRLRGTHSGPTKFVDLTVREKGMYSALDSTRGRVFTYDSEGNLLYVFGGIGNQLGTFKQPVAIASRNDILYVLDQARGQIVVFQPSRYGGLINQAIGLRYDGDESQAVACWNEVLKLDSHYELAYAGIGKSLLSENRNREAMTYLKKGMDKRNYSIAFHRYRNEWMRAHGFQVTIILCAVIVFFMARSLLRKHRAKGRNGRIVSAE